MDGCCDMCAMPLTWSGVRIVTFMGGRFRYHVNCFLEYIVPGARVRVGSRG